MSALWKQLKTRLSPRDLDRVDFFLSAPFFAIHAALLAIPALGFGGREALFALGFYLVGMFFVTAGYHRYFSHRAFRTSRAFQLLLAIGAQLTIQRSVLWWAAHHRHHHRASDRPDDAHSPQRGFFWSHVGWFLCNRHEETRLELVKDFARFPELRWLDRWYWAPPLVFSALVFAFGGLRLLVGGYLLGVVVLYHATFAINSLAHVWGSRRFETKDDSRNNFWLALLTLGEGWHNNHHHFPSAARQGLRWWEIDVSYYLLRLLALLRIVRDLRPIPQYARARRPRAGLAITERSRTRHLGSTWRALRLASLLAIFLLPREAAAANVRSFVGEARRADGKLAYIERHREFHQGGILQRAVTSYYGPDGKLIARLVSRYGEPRHAPTYVYTDYRRADFNEGARLQGGLLSMQAKGKSKSVRPPKDAPLVLGQGLHHFVRHNIDRLRRGETLRIHFAIPSRFDTYRFRVRPLGRERNGVLRMRVEIDSWLLRLLAPDIEVAYDVRAGRLLRYRGVSNIKKRDGDQQRVTIRYRYAATTASRLHEERRK